MVLFISFSYTISDHVYFEGERIAVTEYYKGRGELCNITKYWQNRRFEIVITYFIACAIKLFNLFTAFDTEVKVFAQSINVSVENALRIRYF